MLIDSSGKIASPQNTGLNPMHIIKRGDSLVPSPPGACMTDNRLARIWTLRKHYYLTLKANLLSGISPITLARTQFPFLLPTAKRPPGLFVELTNLCNLRCSYCTSSLKLRPQGMMDESTFNRLIDQIQAIGIERVYLIGNGEPTIHPEFNVFVRQLAKSTRFVSLTTNWQKVDEQTIESVVRAPVDLINVSVDGFDTNSYEDSRIGGSLERLIRNLTELKHARPAGIRRPVINARVMLRPSQFDRREEIFEFWAPYCDEVSTQYVINSTGKGGDVYGIKGDPGHYPHCSFTFKQLNVNWNGDVPLCSYSGYQADDPSEAILGNINHQTIEQLWNHPLIRQYRMAQRKRLGDQMPLCNGCGGC